MTTREPRAEGRGPRVRGVACALVLFFAYGCATTAPPATAKPPEAMRGVASWYGEEFAGRTTANGEIFDPMLLTAAHRTLPFGTVLDITNPKTTQTVRVRVNDRGPYIGNRVIDLSYGAAQQIGLVQAGVGEVEIKVVKIGNGEREAPAPFDVTIAEAPRVAPPPAPARSAGDPPPVAFPLPHQTDESPTTATTATTADGDVVVDRIDVQVERGGMITRKQVSRDGTEIEEVAVGPGEATSASSLDEQQRNERRRAAAAPRPRETKPERFFVQVGAFSVESNAIALRERLRSLGHTAAIDFDQSLYRVRIGPFSARDAAVESRTALEARGLSALIVTE